MSDTLYLQLDQNVQVHHPHVYLQDIAKLSCTNAKVLNKVRVLPVADLDAGKPGRYVMNALELVEMIQKKEENLEISLIGEASFIITYERKKGPHLAAEVLKTAFVCLASFFGTAFSIMTFNNDVDVGDLFARLYRQMTGTASSGFTILEITYSIGIGLGVLFFFNHFGRMKLTDDPTPMQVQMRLYEDNVNTTIMEEADRLQKNKKNKAR